MLQIHAQGMYFFFNKTRQLLYSDRTTNYTVVLTPNTGCGTQQSTVMRTNEREVHRPNYAAAKDAQIKLRKEECASSMGMGQRSRSANAAVKDAQIKPYEQEYAFGMV